MYLHYISVSTSEHNGCIQYTWGNSTSSTAHGLPPYLVEQVDGSSEGQDEVNWLPVTVCQIRGHLERMGMWTVNGCNRRPRDIATYAQLVLACHTNTHLTIPLHIFYIGLYKGENHVSQQWAGLEHTALQYIRVPCAPLTLQCHAHNGPPCPIIHAHLWQFLPVHLHTQPKDVLATNVYHLLGL